MLPLQACCKLGDDFKTHPFEAMHHGKRKETLNKSW